jgi:Flp pilus assembly protein TadD
MLKALGRLFHGRTSDVCKAAPVKSIPPDELLAKPLEALRAGRQHEAVELLEALLQAHPEIAEAHVLLGSILQEQRDFEAAQDSYVLASCFRPEWWMPQFRLGLVALDQQKYKEAVQPLCKALELGAADARVYNALGAAHVYSENVPAAVEAFTKAVTLQPDLTEAHSNLGYVLFRDMEEYEAGARHIERSLELAPDDPAARCNWIMVLQHRNRMDEALALADDLLARDPTLVEARVNRAVMLLKKGDFDRGWREYEARKQSPRTGCTNDLPWPEWNGSSLAGRSIFVYPEQGLGDEIMFASCLPQLLELADLCIVQCHPKLKPIFRRSFPNAEILVQDEWRSAPALSSRPPDWKVSIGSLPLFFRRSVDAFPTHTGYLRADVAKAARWKAKLDALPGRTKVGISWRGGSASTRLSLRSVALQEWLPILKLAGIDFVSLQYSDPDGDLEALRSAAGVDVVQWPEAIDDYDETAALVSGLDLVVSVQTAIVHLAGALGKTTWALIPAIPEWRYGAAGSSMPWYPSVTLIRQAELRCWGPVIEAVRSDLQRLSEAKALLT